MFIFIYIYIIIGEDETTSSFMRQQFSCIYNIYVSKKTNKVDIYHNNTRQTKNQNQYYLFFIFANKNLFKCLHLLISSGFLFRRSLLLRNLIIHSSSVMHNGQIIELGFPLTFDATEYLMERLMLLPFNYFYFKNNILYVSKHVLKSTHFIVSCTH